MTRVWGVTMMVCVGVDIASIPLSRLRSAIKVVSQDALMCSDTIRNNLLGALYCFVDQYRIMACQLSRLSHGPYSDRRTSVGCLAAGSFSRVETTER